MTTSDQLPDELKSMITGYYGKRNLALLNAMAAIYTATLSLADDGFEVLRATINASGNPVLWLRNSSLTSRFRSVVMITRRGECGRELVRAAPYRGVQLQWTEKGN